jgi:large subunit ribosomal protein L16
MLQPKKMKYPKWQKGKSKGVSQKGSELSFGSFGLKALDTKWITARQIEAGRLAIVRTLKRKGKIWIRIFPHKPITSKGVEVPMGGGKGRISHYVFPIRPGRIIFELEGVDEEKARQALTKAGAKLPIKTKFVKK